MWLVWKEKEIKILKEDYCDKGDSLSKVLNKSPNAIRIKAFRIGVSRYDKRNAIKLTEKEEQLILGGLLGDLYCKTTRTTKNARLEGAHCKKQKLYLLWKVSLFENLSFNVRKTKLATFFYKSKSYSCLNYYSNLFYKNGKKEINLVILDKLNEFGLAIWYMDDGSFHKRDSTCRIYTNGFSYNENDLIKEWFGERWSIFPRIYKARDPKNYPGKVWFYLYFGRKETEKLFELIKNYIHPSMSYKIGVSNSNKEDLIENGR
ncbi:MAG: hypothetical protein ABIJ20_04970 [Nanoarchaeota archaeon]|nr:hypothetical protein [Nanoarchaeota archaeon]